jgi:hypothetical protein
LVASGKVQAWKLSYGKEKKHTIKFGEEIKYKPEFLINFGTNGNTGQT